MQIITNADDFGFDEDTLKATIECFEGGSLTSATIMPNMPQTQAAIEYAVAHPSHSYGVHLTFVSDGVERPICAPDEIPSLVDEHGLFKGSQQTRVLALRNKVDAADIERELRAQIERLLDAGVPLSHVDSHGHLHKFKPFCMALQRVLPSYNIKRVRTVQDIYLKKPLKSPTLWLGGRWRRRIKKYFATTDHLYTPTSAGDLSWPEGFLSVIRGKGIVEVAVHPGHIEDWRDSERKTVQHLGSLVSASPHSLANWNDVPQ